MYRIWGRVLLPTILFVFAGLLLSLLLASPSTISAGKPSAPAEASTQSMFLPWEPMLRPADGVSELQSILTGLNRTNRNDRLAILQSIHEDGARPEVQRGLASFAAGVLLLENRRGSEGLAFLRSDAIDATELPGYALFLAARELELSRPEDALELLEEIEKDHAEIALIDDVRLVTARLLRRTGDKEAALAKLRLVAGSSDPKLRGEALDELGSLLFETERHAEAVVVLETLYYELPRHPRASAAGRLLNLARAKLTPPDPLRLYVLGLE
ncbi:MAG: tetratricopeptide repeat protein, partial [Vicinamibacteria bacterium]